MGICYLYIGFHTKNSVCVQEEVDEQVEAKERKKKIIQSPAGALVLRRTSRANVSEASEKVRAS